MLVSFVSVWCFARLASCFVRFASRLVRLHGALSALSRVWYVLRGAFALRWCFVPCLFRYASGLHQCCICTTFVTRSVHVCFTTGLRWYCVRATFVTRSIHVCFASSLHLCCVRATFVTRLIHVCFASSLHRCCVCATFVTRSIHVCFATSLHRCCVRAAFVTCSIHVCLHLVCVDVAFVQRSLRVRYMTVPRLLHECSTHSAFVHIAPVPNTREYLKTYTEREHELLVTTLLQ